MEASVTLGDQIEALLRRLLETEGIEILVRKSTAHSPPANRGRVAKTKNAAAPGIQDAQEKHDAVIENEKGDVLRPMLGMKQVLKIVPVSRTTLFRMTEMGKFPSSRSLSGGRIAWFEDEVRAWQEALDKRRKPIG
jgi:prophage regulatory protein